MLCLYLIDRGPAAARPVRRPLHNRCQLPVKGAGSGAGPRPWELALEADRCRALNRPAAHRALGKCATTVSLLGTKRGGHIATPLVGRQLLAAFVARRRAATAPRDVINPGMAEPPGPLLRNQTDTQAI